MKQICSSCSGGGTVDSSGFGDSIICPDCLGAGRVDLVYHKWLVVTEDGATVAELDAAAKAEADQFARETFGPDVQVRRLDKLADQLVDQSDRLATADKQLPVTDQLLIVCGKQSPCGDVADINWWGLVKLAWWMFRHNVRIKVERSSKME